MKINPAARLPLLVKKNFVVCDLMAVFCLVDRYNLPKCLLVQACDSAHGNIQR